MTEVQQWDLEQLDAFLAFRNMTKSSQAAVDAFANRDVRGSKNGRG